MLNEKLDDFEIKIDNITSSTTNIPEWATEMLNIFKGLVVELKALNAGVSKMCEMESLLAVQKNTTDHLLTEKDRLKNEVELLKAKVDLSEQRGRNINLLLHGVPEEQGEKTTEKSASIISKEVMIPLSSDDIARSHRLGPPSSHITRNTKPRPIIIRFKDEVKKLDIYKNKKNLKGKGLLLTENLTKIRYNIYKKAITKFGHRNVWTSEGRILTSINGKNTEISTENDTLLVS